MNEKMIQNPSQVSQTDLKLINQKYEEAQIWGGNIFGGSTNILEEVKQAAESATYQSGFVYEETSGLYYDYSTGYYYDAVQRLYYDGNSGTYYSYDGERNSYNIHSQVIIDNEKSICIKNRKRKVRIMKSKILKTPEEGEYSESESTSSESSNEIEYEDENENEKEIAKIYPPCMRIIVKETKLKRLKMGGLFIIAYTGGSLGREGEHHTVLIPDLNVSKQHARVQYNEQKKHYEIVDLGSRNGTFLNGKRLSVAKYESEPMEISHGSIIEVGCTKLLCHIHNGYETCGHCEPGLVQQDCIQSNNSASIEQQYKSELTRLKKKFGITKNNIQYASKLALGYQDRAQSRRDYVGSSNHYAKTEQSSIYTSIAKNNKGFKLLAKMGWTEGQSLGKKSDGVVEPIPLTNNSSKSGFGSLSPDYIHMEVAKNVEKKNRLWRKARLRFNQIAESSDYEDLNKIN